MFASARAWSYHANSMKSPVRTIAIVLVVLALIVLIGMLAVREGIENASPPPAVLTIEQRDEAERIIRARINTLSPTPPKLGGRFTVTEIEWDGRGTARVRYDDDESDLAARVSVEAGSGGRVQIGEFLLE